MPCHAMPVLIVYMVARKERRCVGTGAFVARSSLWSLPTVSFSCYVVSSLRIIIIIIITVIITMLVVSNAQRSWSPDDALPWTSCHPPNDWLANHPTLPGDTRESSLGRVGGAARGSGTDCRIWSQFSSPSLWPVASGDSLCVVGESWSMAGTWSVEWCVFFTTNRRDRVVSLCGSNSTSQRNQHHGHQQFPLQQWQQQQQQQQPLRLALVHPLCDPLRCIPAKRRHPLDPHPLPLLPRASFRLSKLRLANIITIPMMIIRKINVTRTMVGPKHSTPSLTNHRLPLPLHFFDAAIPRSKTLKPLPRNDDHLDHVWPLPTPCPPRSLHYWTQRNATTRMVRETRKMIDRDCPKQQNNSNTHALRSPPSALDRVAPAARHIVPPWHILLVMRKCWNEGCVPFRNNCANDAPKRPP